MFGEKNKKFPKTSKGEPTKSKVHPERIRFIEKWRALFNKREQEIIIRVQFGTGIPLFFSEKESREKWFENYGKNLPALFRVTSRLKLEYQWGEGIRTSWSLDFKDICFYLKYRILEPLKHGIGFKAITPKDLQSKITDWQYSPVVIIGNFQRFQQNPEISFQLGLETAEIEIIGNPDLERDTIVIKDLKTAKIFAEFITEEANRLQQIQEIPIEENIKLVVELLGGGVAPPHIIIKSLCDELVRVWEEIEMLKKSVKE